MTFTVGQTVFVQSRDNTKPSEKCPPLGPRTVHKIGRKWVTISPPGWAVERFSPDEPMHDGSGSYPIYGGVYSSPGRVWLSPEAQANWYRRREAWGAVPYIMRGTMPPPHLTLEQIHDLAKLLRGPEGA